MVSFLPLLSCELSVSVKDNSDRKKRRFLRRRSELKKVDNSGISSSVIRPENNLTYTLSCFGLMQISSLEEEDIISQIIFLMSLLDIMPKKAVMKMFNKMRLLASRSNK